MHTEHKLTTDLCESPDNMYLHHTAVYCIFIYLTFIADFWDPNDCPLDRQDPSFHLAPKLSRSDG